MRSSLRLLVTLAMLALLGPATTAAAAPAPTGDDGRLALIGGDLVDLRTMQVRHRLTTELVLSHAIAGDTIYLWSRSRGAAGEQLSAYAVDTGQRRWSQSAPGCWTLAASPRGVLCPSSSGARFHDRATGIPRTVGAISGVVSVLRLGSGLLVLHQDQQLESLDERGEPVSVARLPVQPDTPLQVAGPLACGAQRSDAATVVLCVDSTARLVWQKRVPVPGGLLRQVDASALVVTSDSWTRRPASAVLRPSDGALLLRLDRVRAGAALMEGGQLQAVLSSTDQGAVTLHDPAGAPRWTWKTTPFYRGALRAVRRGQEVVVALYNPIATGALLVALDAATGQLRWTGQVESLPIAHSKYSNQVSLRAQVPAGPDPGAGTGLLLLGHESSQDYAQTFDAATGRRLASILRRR
jgi:outer membrane protein assembly factor BamB